MSRLELSHKIVVKWFTQRIKHESLFESFVCSKIVSWYHKFSAEMFSNESLQCTLEKQSSHLITFIFSVHNVYQHFYPFFSFEKINSFSSRTIISYKKLTLSTTQHSAYRKDIQNIFLKGSSKHIFYISKNKRSL